VLIVAPNERAALTAVMTMRCRRASRSSVSSGIRDECLNETLFASLSHARSVLSGWCHDYNHVRPHRGIGGLTPADAARRVVQPRPQGHHDNPGLQL